MKTHKISTCACLLFGVGLFAICLLEPTMKASADQAIVTQQPNEKNENTTEESVVIEKVAMAGIDPFLAHTVSANGIENPTLAEALEPAAEEPSAWEESQEEAQEEPDPNPNVATANVELALNIRQEGMEDAEIVGKLYRGCVATVDEARDGWLAVTSGDVSGWVSADYMVTGTDAEALLSELNPHVATITAEKLNVRQKADQKSTVLAVAYENQSFMAKAVNDEWVEITYTPDLTGYVSAEYVNLDAQPGVAISKEELTALDKEAAAKEAERKAAEKKKEAEVTKGKSTNASVDEVTLLAALCQYEAGNSYEGALAVANVVLNRVRSGGFPNSIKGVVYQPGQFGGASQGALNKYLAKGPGKTALKAAKDALAGKNNIGGYTSFCSARIANVAAYSSYTIVGGNCFYSK